MKTILLFIILLMGIPLSSNSQNKELNIDSLKYVCDLPDEASEAFNKLNDTLFYFFYNDISKADKIIPDMKYYSDLINDNRSKAIYYQTYGYYKEYKYESDSAIHYLKLSIKYFLKDSAQRSPNLNIDLATIYNAIAQIYDNAGLYKSSIRNHLDAIKLLEELLNKDPQNKRNIRLLASAYNEIAQTYSNVKDSLNTEYFFKKSINFAKKYNLTEIEATNKFNYGIYLMDIGETDKAFPILEKTKSTLQESDFSSFLIVNLNEAKINLLKKDYDKAVSLCKETYKLATEREFFDIAESSLYMLSNIYTEQGNIDMALKYALILEKLYNKYHDPEIKLKGDFHIAELYKKKGNYKKACYYQQQYIKTNDSIVNAETQERINNLKLRFSLEKQVTKNKLLKAHNQMKDNKIKQQKRNNLILLFLIAFGLVFSGSLYYFFNKAKTTNKKLQKLNNELSQNKKDLEQLYNTQKNLFAIISHDLKGPIGTAKSFFDILNNDDIEISDEDRRQYIKTLGRTISGTYELLENILFWSKNRMTNTKIETEYFYPFAEVNELLNNLESTIFTKEIKLRNLIDPTVKINSCLSIFKVIMRNLITNAIKYTPREGIVEINMEENNDLYTFSVKDTGVGMNSEKLNSLFVEKNKKSTPGTEKEKGTGLGLMISAELVEKLGGRIWAESTENKGSTFYFTIKKAS